MKHQSQQTSSFRKIAIMTAITAILFGGIVLLARNSEANDEKRAAGATGSISTLQVTELSYDFGIVSMARGKVSHVYRIKNTGKEAVLITRVYTSCMCTSATLRTRAGAIGPFGMMGHGFIPSIHEVIEPGEVAEVEAVFDPAAHGPAGIGKISRVVSLESGSAKPIQLAFSATVTP